MSPSPWREEQQTTRKNRATQPMNVERLGYYKQYIAGLSWVNILSALRLSLLIEYQILLCNKYLHQLHEITINK